MSLTKSAKAQKTNIVAHASGFFFLGLACIEAAREEDLQEYYKRAGVPAINASNKAKKEWLSEFLSPALMQINIGGSWVGAILSTRKDNAHTFAEGAAIEAVKNASGLQVEYGSKAAEDKPRTAFVYIVCKKREKVVKQDLGAAGKIYELEEDGKTVKTKIVEYNKYICKRPTDKNGNELYKLDELISAFFSVLGIPAAIAKEAAARTQLRAAKAVEAAHLAEIAAKQTAERAKEAAEAAEQRKADKAEAAAKAEADNKMTKAEAHEIVQAAENDKAAKEAAKAEKKQRQSGKQRKGSCKQTKKDNAHDLHNYEKIVK